MIFIHLFVFGKYSAIFSSSCQVTNLEFDSHLTALSRDLFIFITDWSDGWSSSLHTQLVRALQLQKPSLWSAKHDHERNKWSILLFNIHSTLQDLSTSKTVKYRKPLWASCLLDPPFFQPPNHHVFVSRFLQCFQFCSFANTP